MPAFSESALIAFLSVGHTLSDMWIDDTTADVIRVDFDALYHGDVLWEGDTSEQFDDLTPLPTAV